MKKAILLTVLFALFATTIYAADSKYETGILYIATAVINEAPGTADHVCRLGIAIEFWENPQQWADKLSPWLTSQGISPSSAQNDINNSLSAWLTTNVVVMKAKGTCE